MKQEYLKLAKRRILSSQCSCRSYAVAAVSTESPGPEFPLGMERTKKDGMPYWKDRRKDSRNHPRQPAVRIKEALRYLNAAECNQKTTFELSIKLATRVSAGKVRGAVDLPSPFKGQKRSKVCVFADGSAAEAARRMGASKVGGAEMVQELLDMAVIPYHTIYAHPDLLPRLAPLARKLGPLGLMPSTRRGTVDKDIEGLMESMKNTPFEEARSTICKPIGTSDNDIGQLTSNIQALVKGVQHDLDNRVNKGEKVPVTIKELVLRSTKGPNILIQLEEEPLDA
jgi:ribosomal protein L1